MVTSRNTVHDFARRTLKNLEAIEEMARKDPNDYFEVTQLINSAIGLLIFPKEVDYDSIPEIALDNLPMEIPLPKILHGRLPKDNLRELVRYLRNGFAHYNVEFENFNNQIVGVYIWNGEGGGVDWVAYTSVDDLRKLLIFTANKLINATKKSQNISALEQLERQLKVNLRLISREGIN